jgi:2'-5' RNA ligase
MLAVELEPGPQLAAWHAQLCRAWPVAAPERTYRPHVTLARSRRPLAMPEVDCPVSTLALDAPRLYESLTLPTGASYRPWHTDAAR